MPRTLSRRGCAVCKLRKIKCDEQSPECGPCLKARRQCPGPKTDLVFVKAATSRAKRPRRSSPNRKTSHNLEGLGDAQKVSRQGARPLSERTRAHQSDDAPAASTKSSRDSLRDTLSSTYADPLRFSMQSSPVTSLQGQLLNFFIEDFGCLHIEPHHARPWALHLPSQVHSSDLEDHFHKSASGAAMAFYGLITVNNAMKEEARRIYASSLETHRKLLVCFPRIVRRKDEGERALYVRSLVAITLLLSSFELLLPAGLNSWFSHCEGAAFLLSAAGPQACSEGFLHQVFLVIRFGCALITLTTCKPTFLGEHEWTTVPFATAPKTSLDELLDLILSLPWSRIYQASFAATRDDKTIRECITKMDRWRIKYKDILSPDYVDRILRIHNATDAGIQRTTAVLVALFDSVLVKLYSLLEAPNEVDKQRHLQCSGAVIAAALVIAQQFNHHARVQVTIPTLIVASHGASAPQRQQARTLLETFEAGERLGDPAAVGRIRQLLMTEV